MLLTWWIIFMTLMNSNETFFGIKLHKSIRHCQLVLSINSEKHNAMQVFQPRAIIELGYRWKFNSNEFIVFLHWRKSYKAKEIISEITLKIYFCYKTRYFFNQIVSSGRFDANLTVYKQMIYIIFSLQNSFHLKHDT